MSCQPRPRHAPPWDGSPRPRHQAPPTRRRGGAPPGRRRLTDAWILFWTIAAIAGTIGGVAVMTVLSPSVLLSSPGPGMEAVMRKILRRGKVAAAALTAVALGLAAGFVLGMNSGAGAAAAAPRVAAGGIAAGYTAVDPRDPAAARQVFLGQPLSGNAPIFPGDPRSDGSSGTASTPIPASPAAPRDRATPWSRSSHWARTPARTYPRRATSTRARPASTSCPRNSSGCAR